jgi:hypothetical protein
MPARPGGTTPGSRHLALQQFNNVSFVHVRRTIPDLASRSRPEGKRIVTEYEIRA